MTTHDKVNKESFGCFDIKMHRNTWFSLYSEYQNLTKENEELKWFRDRINSYVMPGETDTLDAALVLFKNLEADNKQLKENTLKDFKDIQELKTIIKEMSDHSKRYAHCGMDMFAHTKWRKFADELKI